MNIVPLMRALVEDLRHLAAEPSEQEAYLRQLGTWDCLDELALDFDHSYDVLKTLGALTGVQIEALDPIDKKLDAMSGESHAELWYGDALLRPEWAEVRELARRAFELFW